MQTESQAEVVEKSSESIAACACEHLLSANSELQNRFGDETQKLWTEHLNQRVLELSAAMAAGDQHLFATRVAWSRAAMQARNFETGDLFVSLQSLRAGVDEALEGESRTTALGFIDYALGVVNDLQVEDDRPSLDAGVECDRLALQYVQTVVAGNVFPGMQLVFDAVARGLPIQDAYLRVLLPAQAEVGRLWHLNELSVSEEHLVSHTTQRLMAVLSTRMPRKPDNGYTVIAGAVAGNIHDIGIRAISYLLEFDGWHTIYLGSDIPRSELPAIVASFGADVVMLSVALSSQIPATQRAIAEVRNSSSSGVKIMVGGNGMRERPELWKELGADAFAPDALQALALALKIASN